MTIRRDLISPSQILLDPYRRLFFDWARKQNSIFTYDDDKPPLTQIIYVLAKRLKQPIEYLMSMPAEERDHLYKMEMDLIAHEQKQSSANNNNLIHNNM